MSDIQKYNTPTALVIFGGTGDLAITKLLPALFDLYIQNKLPNSFVLVGISRKEMTHEDYQLYVKNILLAKNKDNQQNIDLFCNHIKYVAGDFATIEVYEKLKKELSLFDESIGQCTSKLFYVATSPNSYGQIFSNLKESNAMALCDNVGSWSRLLVEKPFGRDLATAIALEKQLCDLFSEDQIYRIDHYLAKDAIENIISLHFANSVLSSSWNNTCIESMSIKLFETKDVLNRGSFYDDIGTLRDVGQNHMLQILALLTMKNVALQDGKAMHQARTEALRYLSQQKIHTVIRGQYKGFTDVSGVTENSQTETYFKIETELAAKEWEGVRFTLEAGKALDKDNTEAVVTFRALNQCSCGLQEGSHEHKNVLTIIFAPEQIIKLAVWVKKPGFDFVLEKRELEFTHTESGDAKSPEAYERVLFDCITGDQTRFVSGDEVRAAWEFITPVLETFKSLPLHVYEQGTSGPLYN